MVKSLDELGSVPWERLRHCYGPASDVSEMLRDQLLLVLRWMHRRADRVTTAGLTHRVGKFLPTAGAAFFLTDLRKSLPVDQQTLEAVDLALLQSPLDLDDYMEPNLYGTAAPRPLPVTDVWMDPPFETAEILFAGPNLTVLKLPTGGRRLARISHADLRVGRPVQFRVWRDPGPWTLLCETEAGTKAMLFDETGEVALESRLGAANHQADRPGRQCIPAPFVAPRCIAAVYGLVAPREPGALTPWIDRLGDSRPLSDDGWMNLIARAGGAIGQSGQRGEPRPAGATGTAGRSVRRDHGGWWHCGWLGRRL